MCRGLPVVFCLSACRPCLLTCLPDTPPVLSVRLPVCPPSSLSVCLSFLFCLFLFVWWSVLIHGLGTFGRLLVPPYICLSACLSACVVVDINSWFWDVRPHTCPTKYMSVCLFVCVPVCLPVCLCSYLSAGLPTYLSVCHFVSNYLSHTYIRILSLTPINRNERISIICNPPIQLPFC